MIPYVCRIAWGGPAIIHGTCLICVRTYFDSSSGIPSVIFSGSVHELTNYTNKKGYVWPSMG